MYSFVGMPWIPGPNGHFYRYVRITGGIGWNAARDAAAIADPPQLGYVTHLATLTSAEEADFVSALVSSDAYVMGNIGGGMWGPWVGGYQDTDSPDYTEPRGGWRWVTDESWGYTRWSKNEPNNSAAGRPEGFLHLFAQPESFEKIRDGKWNDITDNPSNLIQGYIVEATPN